jgi:hypothetical protein
MMEQSYFFAIRIESAASSASCHFIPFDLCDNFLSRKAFRSLAEEILYLHLFLDIFEDH